MKNTIDYVINTEKWIRPLNGGLRYDEPACVYSEHRFLVLLYLLWQYKNKFREIPPEFIAPITLHSFDEQNQIVANALVKKKITLGGETYHLGEKTYLVLDTNFAGIVARIYPRSRFANTIPTQALRVLLRKSTFGASIVDSETVKQSVPIFKTEKQIKLLEKIQELITSQGYIHAIISLLTKLQVPFDKKAFVENIEG